MLLGVDAFEVDGAETRQRNDGRTVELRVKRNLLNIPFLVRCVSHWRTAKERIVLPLD